eukprot:INCI19027.1.p1 GENE.INCI19027.1~~INCI19027.1.p1  ORF type:complete len:1574 (-),score=205.88 INCI19027.1:21-4742(-)
MYDVCMYVCMYGVCECVCVMYVMYAIPVLFPAAALLLLIMAAVPSFRCCCCCFFFVSRGVEMLLRARDVQRWWESAMAFATLPRKIRCTAAGGGGGGGPSLVLCVVVALLLSAAVPDVCASRVAGEVAQQWQSSYPFGRRSTLARDRQTIYSSPNSVSVGECGVRKLFVASGTFGASFTTADCGVGQKILSSDGSTLYFYSWSNYIYALHTGNFSIRWQITVAGGHASTMALSKDEATLFSAGTGLSAIRTNDGALLWENTNADGSTTALIMLSPDGERVYGGGTDTFHAWNATDGAELWNWAHDSYYSAEYPFSVSSDGSTIYVPLQLTLRAIDAWNASTVWTYTYNNPQGATFCNGPAVQSVDGSLLFVTGWYSCGGGTVALHASNASVVWTAPQDIGIARGIRLASRGNSLLLGSTVSSTLPHSSTCPYDTTFYSLDTRNGSLQWTGVVAGSSLDMRYAMPSLDETTIWFTTIWNGAVSVSIVTDCVGAWSAWTACAETCGTSTKSRTFHVATPAQWGGVNCSTSDGNIATSLCSGLCPVDCVGEWLPWSVCSRTCGSGVREREYNVSAPAQHGGYCATSDTVSAVGECSIQPCPEDCQGAWSPWGECSVTCGEGGRNRTFQVSAPAQWGGASCTVDDGGVAISSCGDPCPVDCVGEWMPWAGCSRSCNAGVRARVFSVTAPSQYGGYCLASDEDAAFGICETQPCPEDCEGAWSPWTQCSLTCGGGWRNRTFQVSAPALWGGGCTIPNGTSDVGACQLADCPVDCVGEWSAWSSCDGPCATSIRPSRLFLVTRAPSNGGALCAYSGGDEEWNATLCPPAPCTTTSQSSDDHLAAAASLVVPVSGAVGGAVVIAIGIGVALFYVNRKKEQHRQHDRPSRLVSHRAVAFAVEEDGRNPETILDDISAALDADTTQWSLIHALAKDVVAYQRGSGCASEDMAMDPTLSRAFVVLQRAFDEFQLLTDRAAETGDFASASIYSDRIKLLRSSVSNLTRQEPASSNLECVVDGLLLNKDRFNGNSDAFLGRGATSAVSRGIWFERIGSHETRTTVAVKEIQKTGLDTERDATREYLLLAKKLGPHPNVIRIHNVMSTGNMFYILMEYCDFSLDKVPEEFGVFLQAPSSTVGALVLNALVQDLVRAVGFLHSKHVFHCDLKPANVLVSFDRGGKRRSFKRKYFDKAQLKMADFGVSRVVSPPSGDGQTVTVTMSIADTDGIAGTETFMCPELLRHLRLLQARATDVEPDILPDLLTTNDSFGVGCVLAYMCSGGRHPFQHALFRNIGDNIVAHRRLPLADLGIQCQLHLELVDRFTTWEPEHQWTVLQALRLSTVFEGASHDTGSEILLDQLQLFQQPEGTCQDQLLSPAIAKLCPLMHEMVVGINHIVDELVAGNMPVPTKLDEDSYRAIVAYSMDNGRDIHSNIYFALNNALRTRKSDPAPFQCWQGFFFFLMQALDKLPMFRGTVYRGGNKGIDQGTVRQQYKLGRPIQWAAFSSTSRSAAAAKLFVTKDTGVIFKISVVTGRDIGAYSYFPKESEVLLPPSTRFTVTSEIYTDDEGFAFVDLTETTGGMLRS